MSDPLKEPGVARTPDVTIELLKENERLRALLDAARICFKNRDQSEREAAVYAEIRRALEEKT